MNHPINSLAPVYSPEVQHIVDALNESFCELERAEEAFTRGREHLAKAKALFREGGARLLEKLDAGATAPRG
jgi:hypothetical protein